MIFSGRKSFKLTFTLSCVTIVIIMVGYWFCKYAIIDKSINVVDYVPMKETEGIKLPVASLCFDNPFLKQKFSDLDHTVNETSYLEYLNGHVQGKEFEKIAYRKVSLNIGHYFIGGKELWINETEYRDISLSVGHIASFNGFYYPNFMKCFSINISNEKQSHIKELIIMYNKDLLMNDWSNSKWHKDKHRYSVHYPGQFLIGELNSGISMKDPLKIIIKEIEILQRRNERNKKCIEHSNSYDKRVVNKYIFDKGWRLAYLNGEEQTQLCRQMKMLKESRFQYATMRSIDIVPDCQVVSKLEESQKVWVLTGIVLEKEKLNSTLIIQMIYPDKIKIITSTKEIDIHTLIGNIGGYLGLFLVYALVQLPDMIFYMYDYVQIQVQRKKPLITHSSASVEFREENVMHFQKSNNFLNNVSHQKDSIVVVNIPPKNH